MEAGQICSIMLLPSWDFANAIQHKFTQRLQVLRSPCTRQLRLYMRWPLLRLWYGITVAVVKVSRKQIDWQRVRFFLKSSQRMSGVYQVHTYNLCYRRRPLVMIS